MKPLACFAITALLLGGCASDATQPQTPESRSASTPASAAAPASAGGHGCDSATVADLQGKAANAAVLEQARTRAGAMQARLIGPDDAVTLDYNSQRLNLGVDAAGVVQTISCG